MKQHELLVEVEGISKKFARNLKTSLLYGLKDLGRELTGRSVTPDLRSDEFWALQGVGFQLRRGEAIGVIGHNGAGKSTLLKILTGLIKPTTGEIRMHGRVQALIELGSGMNPILTGRENIYINAAVMGIDKATIDRKLDDIIAFAELEEFIDMPFQNYSSGMRVRLGFAIAINVDPDILIIDEVLSVGDSKFKRKARLEFEKLLKKDVAIIFVSHNLHEVNKITQRCIWLERGQVAAFDETHKVISQYVSRAGDDETISEEGFIAPPLEKSPDKSSGHMNLSAVSVDGSPKRHVSWDKALTIAPITINIELEVLKPINDIVHCIWQMCDEYGDVLGTNDCFVNIRAESGQKLKHEFKLDVSDILPGFYKFALFIQNDELRLIDCAFNAFYLSLKNSLSADHLEKPENYVHKLCVGPDMGSFLLDIKNV